MNFTDIDQFYIKAIAALYCKDHLRTGDAPTLQKIAEDAIKAKSGKDKDFSSFVAPAVKLQAAAEEYKNVTGGIEETKTASSSDNELELDLWKEDLMCVVCKGMDVGARNRLIECCECQILYHQECHSPPVSQEEADQTWTCQSCKNAKQVYTSPVGSRPNSPHTKSSKSSSHKNSSGSSSTSYKSSSSSKNAQKTGSSSSSSKSSSKQSSSSSASSSPAHNQGVSSSSSSSRSLMKPNINIISADKRIQSMKKKAAKLQEKKKLPR
ncbi:integrator complex subunit 12-like [Onthophagus taurus]|uniref:integrator complex subunit 12-like n=1 Tax=Onthophagus taurus TaxID=166361 RepID=UPI000C206643|nr:integrator complex subunit 12-like [Onthophagus taurus]